MDINIKIYAGVQRSKKFSVSRLNLLITDKENIRHKCRMN